MPRIDFIEKTIFDLEEMKVIFLKNEKDVRGDDTSVSRNYPTFRKTKNMATVSKFKDKLKTHFPGFDFIVCDGDGNVASGQTLLATVRDSYLEDD
ncbi:MAG: hypothetical protein RSA73_04235 [Anaerovoracaceae bacterium]